MYPQPLTRLETPSASLHFAFERSEPDFLFLDLTSVFVGFAFSVFVIVDLSFQRGRTDRFLLHYSLGRRGSGFADESVLMKLGHMSSKLCVLVEDL